MAEYLAIQASKQQITSHEGLSHNVVRHLALRIKPISGQSKHV